MRKLVLAVLLASCGHDGGSIRIDEQLANGAACKANSDWTSRYCDSATMLCADQAACI